MSRRDAATYVVKTKPTNRFGPHHGPQADMLVGVNAVTYGKEIPSSAHSMVVKDTCVACHMQVVAPKDPGFLKAGGHTFSMAADLGTNTVELVGACKTCHGPSVTTFNIARIDYDGNGIVEGVQTEVLGLIGQVTKFLPPLGTEKLTLAAMGAAMNTNYTVTQAKAAYNVLFVLEDRSLGVHNTAYAVGLLKASLADITPAAQPPLDLTNLTQTQVNTAIANYFRNSTNVMTNPTVLGNGTFQLGLGADNLLGWGLGVQVSSDLVTWTNLPTAAFQVYQFNDPDATNSPQRFYRMRLP
jgi:hypothetical protein